MHTCSVLTGVAVQVLLYATMSKLAGAAGQLAASAMKLLDPVHHS